MEISGGSWKSMDMEMLIGGFNPSENMKVSWDDDIPNIWENKAMFQTTNQLLRLSF